MNWTTLEDILRQLERLWERGDLLRAIAGKQERFPLRLRLRGPSVRELTSHFPEIDNWVRTMREVADVRIEWRLVRSPVLGRRELPSELWIDTPTAAVRLLAKQEDVEDFLAMYAATQVSLPETLPWLLAHPHRALAARPVWQRVLKVVRWRLENPATAPVYLRQLDLVGIDTKFLEANTSLLRELFNFLNVPFMNAAAEADFCVRYGFLREPPRVRFRMLDPEIGFPSLPDCADIELDVDSFAALRLDVLRAVILENKTTYLVFPPMPRSIAIFGAGYGALSLQQATWLRSLCVLYWGDIDTHGLTILSQLRKFLPQAESILMDEATLFAFRESWTTEPVQCKGMPERLSTEEQTLLRNLQEQRFGEKVRLEQEKISLTYALAVLHDQKNGAEI